MNTELPSVAGAQAEERNLWSAETCLGFPEATCRRRTLGSVVIRRERSRLAPAPARARGRVRVEVRRRPVACAKAVTSHRTPKCVAYQSLRKFVPESPERPTRPSPSPREARMGRGPGRGVPHFCHRSRRGGAPPLPNPLLRSERRRGGPRSRCGWHQLSRRVIAGTQMGIKACLKTRLGVRRLRGSYGVRPADRVNAGLRTQFLAAPGTSQTGA